MRTTIDFEVRLLKRAKAQASRQGLTLSQWVEAAARRELDAPMRTAQPKPFKLVTFGSGGLRPGFTWENLSEETMPLPSLAEDDSGTRR